MMKLDEIISFFQPCGIINNGLPKAYQTILVAYGYEPFKFCDRR